MADSPADLAAPGVETPADSTAPGVGTPADSPARFVETPGSGEVAGGREDAVWRMRGAPLIAAPGPGPLSGHTIAVKDLYAVAGFAIGAGVRDYPGDPEPEHATAVAALLAAGADITGIAHTDEFAYSITGSNGTYGMPVNPAVRQRIPGGSSSGSAVAVARGEATIGLGTDTAGSIRVPAAYQGLWGIRTTHGRISTRGQLPLAQSFDTVGWMTRDPQTLAAVSNCLLPPDTVSTHGAATAGNDHAGDVAKNAANPVAADRIDESTTVTVDLGAEFETASDAVTAEPPRLVVDTGLCEVADPPLAAAVRIAADTLNAAPVALEADLESWFMAFRTVQAYEAWRNHGPWITAHPGALTPEVAQRFAYAATITPAAADRSRRLLEAAASHLRSALTGRILLLPSTATFPPLRTANPAELEAGRTRTLHLTCLASLAGMPAVTFPLAGTDGLPMGLCLIGAPGTDQALIRAAHAAADRLG
ncbi:amidase family protein [Nocardia sp. NPDC056000]|uniref:amidase family protein n=1 Tax=Nocardia sp. NPDC056000 TaxID=3345674 RepID=UPI0035DE6113